MLLTNVRENAGAVVLGSGPRLLGQRLQRRHHVGDADLLRAAHGAGLAGDTHPGRVAPQDLRTKAGPQHGEDHPGGVVHVGCRRAGTAAGAALDAELDAGIDGCGRHHLVKYVQPSPRGPTVARAAARHASAPQTAAATAFVKVQRLPCLGLVIDRERHLEDARAPAHAQGAHDVHAGYRQSLGHVGQTAGPILHLDHDRIALDELVAEAPQDLTHLHEVIGHDEDTGQGARSRTADAVDVHVPRGEGSGQVGQLSGVVVDLDDELPRHRHLPSGPVGGTGRTSSVQLPSMSDRFGPAASSHAPGRVVPRIADGEQCRTARRPGAVGPGVGRRKSRRAQAL